jgi:Uma2 family endonuclease
MKGGAEMVLAMPDEGNRDEVVYSELLVTPALRPWHQIVVQRLGFAIGTYLQREPVAIVLSSPADISSGPDVLVQPEMSVVTPEEARTPSWSRMHTLILVAEVLSPSSSRGDRFLKRLRYREAGIPLYWVVDGDAVGRGVDPSDDFPIIERERLAWHAPSAREQFTLSLEELFRPL